MIGLLKSTCCFKVLIAHAGTLQNFAHVLFFVHPMSIVAQLIEC